MQSISHSESKVQSSECSERRGSLELLVQAVAGGEVAALSSLYTLTVSRVYALARFKLHSKEDAEDIIIDVFTYVWQNAASYDPNRGSVMAWLSIMTQNRSIDLLRRRRADISMNDEQLDIVALSIPDRIHTPEQLVSLAQAEKALHQALQSVDAGRRALIHLAFFEGLTHEEISVAVGLPLGTVKSSLRRTLAVLRQSQVLVQCHRGDITATA